MKAEDLTPDFVGRVYCDYLIHHNFPNELYDVGSKIYIESVDVTNLEPVEKVAGNFLVSGSGEIAIEVDMGEDDTRDDAYPIKFKVEFDGEGKIVRQLSHNIDTSSFYE